MKNKMIYILLIYVLFFFNKQLALAEIKGSIEERTPESIISDYFPTYSSIQLNKNDQRIIEVLEGENILGFIYSTWDMVNSLGYDRSPYEIIIGLNKSGTLAGAKLTYHNEPLFEHDISEQALLDYVERTKGINISKGMTRVSKDKPIRPDTVHRGTISSNLMHEAIFKSSRNAALSVGLYDGLNIVRLNYLKELSLSWKQLLDEKFISYRKVFSNDVLNQTAEYATDYDTRNELFSENIVALISPRGIGYNILGKDRHDKYMASLKSKDHAILIAGNGYSYKGENWRRTKIFDRIRIIQEDKIIQFTSSDHTRISKIEAQGTPKFKEISLFRINSKYNFDPVKSWYLELLYFNENKETVNIIIPYTINEELVIKNNVDIPMWVNIWLDSKFRIAILVFALLVLTCITIFQNNIVKYRRIYRCFRMSYLSFTLIWIGWYTGAQLSIFNVLSIIRIPITGMDLSYFIMDPLVFLILIFTLISTFIMGRGLFCGWLCPFGALQELIGWIGKKFGIKKYEINEKYYSKLWTVKYYILFIILGTSFLSIELASKVAEIEPFKTAIMRHFNRGLPYISYAVILLGVSIFMERGFCRFICPLGASLALVGKLRYMDKLKRRKECGKPCNLCSVSCPVKAIPSKGKDKGKIIMNECFRCLDCQIEYFDSNRCPPLIKKISFF